MAQYRWRPAQEADRPFLSWMYELTETYGDESLPLPDYYPRAYRDYVGRWLASEGGVILEATDLSQSERVAFDSDIRRRDPFDPGFDRQAAFSAAAILPLADAPSDAATLRAGSGAGAPNVEPAVPVGAAWLRFFTPQDARYGHVADGIPEIAVAIRPGAVDNGLSEPLLEGLFEWAKAQGHPGVSLAVDVANPRAARAYEKRGFVYVKTVKEGQYNVMLKEF